MGTIFGKDTATEQRRAAEAEYLRREESARALNNLYETQRRLALEENYRKIQRERLRREADEQRRIYENKLQQEREIQLRKAARASSLRKIKLIAQVLQTPETESWTTQFNTINYNIVFQIIELHSSDIEYMRVANKFQSTTKNQGFKITEIYRIENPSLYGQYLLKKEELKSRYHNVCEKWLFHGTNKNNVDQICKNNLNWRCHGRKIGHRFGQGVSFSPIATYASHYCDNYSSSMFLCFVLVSKECPGEKDMILPPVYNNREQLRFDTAYRDNDKRDVIVKFSDYEYYPMYRIDFTGRKPHSRRR